MEGGVALFTGFTRLCKGLTVVLVIGYAISQLFPSTIDFLALVPGKERGARALEERLATAKPGEGGGEEQSHGDPSNRVYAVLLEGYRSVWDDYQSPKDLYASHNHRRIAAAIWAKN